ncbi:MAG: VENN motif pre-toxin domain-containing protein, partial [Clostridia bacterium]|nr:VENN motif pre-toxin domain-containing protein [Clostridia bacterium]
TAGQGNAQIATNAIAPYASQLIGDTFEHTDDPNKAAQLLSHAVLGAVIAYMNGGDPAAGAASATASELASMALARELYPEAFDEDGNLVRSRLSEEQAESIVAITNAIGALAGGITGGDVYDAGLGSFIGENAVKNNDLGATAIVLGIIALTAYANTPMSADEEPKEGLPLSFLNLPLDTIIITVEMVQGLEKEGLSSEAIVLALAKKFKVPKSVARELYDGAESAKNVVNYEKYKDELSAVMGKPKVSDLDLQKFIDTLYRENAKIGSGSTADAVRYELATGDMVGGKLHIQKAQDSIIYLKRWLNKNPDASFADRQAIEHLIRDMKNALNGK